ncbi:MAG: DUF2779 domain-containing protein [Candidatus Promineifilaceae bacterium]
MLNKSQIKAGMFCQRRLWLSKFRPNLIPPPSAMSELLFKRGIEIGELARTHFPDGVLVDWEPSPELDTYYLMRGDTTTLFEATFQYDDVRIRVDILRKLPDGRWHMIEVKQSGSVKREYLVDAAIQLYVLRGARIDVAQVSVMHLNKQCVHPNLDELFMMTDISAESEQLLPTIADQLTRIKPTLESRTQPVTALDTRCKRCDFKPHCWKHLDDKCVYAIPRLSGQKLKSLVAAGIEHLDDLPAEFNLTDKQQLYVDGMLGAQTVADRPKIRAALDQLTYPIFFLDFEADNPGIPRFDQCRPHQRLPFHWSCHVLEENGDLLHSEYLHVDQSDPRLPFLTNLLNVLRSAGSIVVYNAGYERSLLQELATTFPVYAEVVAGIIGRIWDQHAIFAKHYFDYRFGGSTSLKRVLPVLVPHLSYSVLDVQDGPMAQAEWNRLLHLPEGEIKEQVRQALLAYCRLDTFAMVEIHRVLAETI